MFCKTTGWLVAGMLGVTLSDLV